MDLVPILGIEEINGIKFFRSGHFLRSKHLEGEFFVFKELYFPLQFEEAEYPLYSLVLKISESELLSYQGLIARNLSSISQGPYPDKRKSLYEMYVSLVNQFAPKNYDKELANITILEVMELIQGIWSKGLKDQHLEKLEILIRDIWNEEKIPNSQIDALIQQISDVNTGLEEIIKLNVRYDFCFQSDNENRYYWLRLDQVF